MHDSQTPRLAVTESKNSEKVITFLPLSMDSLTAACSKKYAKRIIAANENGCLKGLHFTDNGNIRATFI